MLIRQYCRDLATTHLRFSNDCIIRDGDYMPNSNIRLSDHGQESTVEQAGFERPANNLDEQQA